MTRKKYVWVVYAGVEGNTSLVTVFSTKKEADYFVKEVYVDNDLNLTWIEKKPIDSPDLVSLNVVVDAYKKGCSFVYIVRFNVYSDNRQDDWVWSNNFVGYSMDLSDRKGIVFSYAENEYEVVILATTHDSALELGKKFITEAIEGGPFDKDYSRPGYIKGWRSDSNMSLLQK